MKIKTLLKSLGIFLVIMMSEACGSREDTVSCFPEQPINVRLNLNLPAYANRLNINNGWIYINEQQSGTRGLILVRTATGYKAYDRNAPHICPNENSTLEVRDNFKIVCPSDGAEWVLQDGTPIKGSGLPPKTYNCSYNPATNVIFIQY